MRVLFLDFDGVLHPWPVETTGRTCHGKPVLRALTVDCFVWRPVLSELLKPHLDVRLVFHSTWRPSMMAATARTLLGPDTGRYLGWAPTAPTWPSIRFVLEMNDQIDDYRIVENVMCGDLEDAPQHHLILCERESGISSLQVLDQLRFWLEEGRQANAWHGRAQALLAEEIRAGNRSGKPIR